LLVILHWHNIASAIDVLWFWLSGTAFYFPVKVVEMPIESTPPPKELDPQLS
jgi:hypothetical protein